MPATVRRLSGGYLAIFIIFSVFFLCLNIENPNRDACAVIRVFLYYFALAVIIWMLVETVHLYRQIVVVFVTNAAQGSTNLDLQNGTVIQILYQIIELKGSLNPEKAFQKIRNLLFIGWFTPLFIAVVNTKIFINQGDPITEIRADGRFSAQKNFQKITDSVI